MGRVTKYIKFGKIVGMDGKSKRKVRIFHQTPQWTSMPPRSRMRNNLLFATRGASTPTTSAQEVASSTSAARSLAASQGPRSPTATPRESINTRVMISGAGEMRIGAARSYASCATNRRATYLCFGISGSQYLIKVGRSPSVVSFRLLAPWRREWREGKKNTQRDE